MKMMATALLALLLFVNLGFFTVLAQNEIRDGEFHVDVRPNGQYAVNVDGVTWLPSGPTFFNNDGKRFCSEEGTLKLVGLKVSQGDDNFGRWNKTTFSYLAGTLSVQTSVKVYMESSLPVAVFSQTFSSAAHKTKGKVRDDIISSFPSVRFPPNHSASLGYLAYGDFMAGWLGLGIGRWTRSEANFTTGIKGGPLVLFDKSSNALVISPLSNFMAASNKKFGDKHVSWGIMGLVDDVPAHYNIDFIIYFSNKGVNEAMRGWGSYLTTLYGKTDRARENDLSLTHLGYWTDNGAYYYYNTEKGKNYEDTMLDTAAYLKTQQLPVKYLQIDSWFYKKGHKDGTRTWAPEKSVFPNGFANLYDKTGLPIGCHNRYWDNDTTYARYNGGKYNFIPDTTTGCAVPDDQGFWNDLFNSTQKWGKFILYEQDWLNAETDRNMVLLTDLYLGRRWLIQMGSGAAKFGVTIQYCMAYSRHILQSLEVPVVTQARASDDYATGEKQWKIGTTSMFIDAMQLAPSKDTFWTSHEEPGNPYKHHEDMPYVQAMVATFSTGPVGPGDGIGYVNSSLLMKCCNSDGLILRASRPITIMDKSLKQAAFVGGNPMGQGEALYSTIANISGHIFGTILATEVNGAYNLEPMDLTPDYPGECEDVTTFIYNSFTGKFREWSSSLPLIVDATTCGTELCVFYSTSLIRVDAYNTRVGLLGEMNSKFSPVSPQRFFALRTTETTDLEVQVRMSAGENIDVWFLTLLKGSSFTLFLGCDNRYSTKPAVFVATLKVNGDSRCAAAV